MKKAKEEKPKETRDQKIERYMKLDKRSLAIMLVDTQNVVDVISNTPRMQTVNAIRIDNGFDPLMVIGPGKPKRRGSKLIGKLKRMS